MCIHIYYFLSVKIVCIEINIMSIIPIVIIIINVSFSMTIHKMIYKLNLLDHYLSESMCINSNYVCHIYVFCK